MSPHDEFVKNTLSEEIVSLQKELVEERKKLANAIALQKLIESGVLLPNYEPNGNKIEEVAQIGAIEEIDIKEENTTPKNTIENQLEEQTNLVESLKKNLVDIENELAIFQSMYDRHYKWEEQYKDWGEDDRPPSGGIAPSPRPRNPSPSPNIDSAAVIR